MRLLTGSLTLFTYLNRYANARSKVPSVCEGLAFGVLSVVRGSVGTAALPATPR